MSTNSEGRWQTIRLATNSGANDADRYAFRLPTAERGFCECRHHATGHRTTEPQRRAGEMRFKEAKFRDPGKRISEFAPLISRLGVLMAIREIPQCCYTD